jgi:hypothetical protein
MAVVVLSAMPQLAQASPGCTALNGSFGPNGASTGHGTGTGFQAGDTITINMVATGGVDLALVDITSSSLLIPNINTVGSVTYTVPADTPNKFGLDAAGGSASTHFTWSCVPASANGGATELRSLQKTATRTGSQMSGIAYSSIIGDAITGAMGSAGGSPSISVIPSGASGLGMGEGSGAEAGVGRRARLTPWVNGRFSESGDDSNIDWQHKTIAAGATYTAAPGLIVGAFGGYEKLDFDQSGDLSGTLDGKGGTAGIYAAWMLAPKLRLDGGIARTWLDYEATAGTAEGDFDGTRWLFLTRLSGDHIAGRWTLTPSTEVFWLHETQDAYTDSLGTAQAKNSFTNGRANAGLQAAYAIPLSQRTTLSPYAGIYADYYFGNESDDDASVSVIGIGDGWAARATGGLTLSGIEGWALTAGAEAGNLGGEGPEFWTGRLGGAVNF